MTRLIARALEWEAPYRLSPLDALFVFLSVVLGVLSLICAILMVTT